MSFVDDTCLPADYVKCLDNLHFSINLLLNLGFTTKVEISILESTQQIGNFGCIVD